MLKVQNNIELIHEIRSHPKLLQIANGPLSARRKEPVHKGKNDFHYSILGLERETGQEKR